AWFASASAYTISSLGQPLAGERRADRKLRTSLRCGDPDRGLAAGEVEHARCTRELRVKQDGDGRQAPRDLAPETSTSEQALSQNHAAYRESNFQRRDTSEHPRHEPDGAPEQKLTRCGNRDDADQRAKQAVRQAERGHQLAGKRKTAAPDRRQILAHRLHDAAAPASLLLFPGGPRMG